MTTGSPGSGPEDLERAAGFDLETRLLEFSAAIIRVAEALPSTRAANHVAGQLLRSGTAALPSHGEAQAAESRSDFLHKMSICLKELRETRRWLRLVPVAGLRASDDPAVASLVGETDQLVRIFAASIRTARKNRAQV